MNSSIRSYSELISIPTFIDRYRYLRLGGRVGEETFGFDRYLNQYFYRTDEWKGIRDFVIVRDLGCDLAHTDYEIKERILIHHMNPISQKDIIHRSEILLDPEFLVSVSLSTHNAIHYGDETKLKSEPIERTPNDTCPWR